jgi:hypothetical protein
MVGTWKDHFPCAITNLLKNDQAKEHLSRDKPRIQAMKIKSNHKKAIKAEKAGQHIRL